MKRLNFAFLLAFVVAMLLCGCKKEKAPETPQKDKQVTLDAVIEQKQKGRKKVNADN